MATNYTDAPNTQTLTEGALQPTTTEQDKSRKVITLVDSLLSNLSLSLIENFLAYTVLKSHYRY